MKQSKIQVAFSVLLLGAAINSLSSESLATPPNDNCTNWLPASNGTTKYTTVGGTTDGVEEFPVCFNAGHADVDHDVWYHYVATCSGELRVDLCNSNFDTKVAVYDGCVCPAPSPPIGCNDDSSDADCAPGSQLTVPVQQGTCYTIRVGGYLGQSGNGVMSLSCDIIPTGACCNRNALQCSESLQERDCQGPGMEWHEGNGCNQINPPCAAAIPTVSEWGIVILALVTLVSAKILFGYQRDKSVLR